VNFFGQETDLLIECITRILDPCSKPTSNFVNNYKPTYTSLTPSLSSRWNHRWVSYATGYILFYYLCRKNLSCGKWSRGFSAQCKTDVVNHKEAKRHVPAAVRCRESKLVAKLLSPPSPRTKWDVSSIDNNHDATRPHATTISSDHRNRKESGWKTTRETLVFVTWWNDVLSTPFLCAKGALRPRHGHFFVQEELSN
jgi:hypothetical protein